MVAVTASFFEAVGEAFILGATAVPVAHGRGRGEKVPRGVVRLSQAQEPLVAEPVLAHLVLGVDSVSPSHALGFARVLAR